MGNGDCRQMRMELNAHIEVFRRNHRIRVRSRKCGDDNGACQLRIFRLRVAQPSKSYSLSQDLTGEHGIRHAASKLHLRTKRREVKNRLTQCNRKGRLAQRREGHKGTPNWRVRTEDRHFNSRDLFDYTGDGKATPIGWRNRFTMPINSESVVHGYIQGS